MIGEGAGIARGGLHGNSDDGRNSGWTVAVLRGRKEYMHCDPDPTH